MYVINGGKLKSWHERLKINETTTLLSVSGRKRPDQLVPTRWLHDLASVRGHYSPEAAIR
jgi:hypothetical protein